MKEINYTYKPMEDYTEKISNLFGEMRATISQLEAEEAAQKNSLETRQQATDLTVAGLKEKKALKNEYELTREFLHEAQKEMTRLKNDNWDTIRIKLLNLRGVYDRFISDQTKDLQDEIDSLLLQAKSKTNEINEIRKEGERNFNGFANKINEIVGIKGGSDRTGVYSSVTDFRREDLAIRLDNLKK